jgi:hypothetical protein
METMSDLESMIWNFNTIKVKYEVVSAKQEEDVEIATTSHREEIKWDTAIKLDHGAGYVYFTCMFYFLDGKYQGHGLWE